MVADVVAVILGWVLTLGPTLVLSAWVGDLGHWIIGGGIMHASIRCLVFVIVPLPLWVLVYQVNLVVVSGDIPRAVLRTILIAFPLPLLATSVVVPAVPIAVLMLIMLTPWAMAIVAHRAAQAQIAKDGAGRAVVQLDDVGRIGAAYAVLAIAAFAFILIGFPIGEKLAMLTNTRTYDPEGWAWWIAVMMVVILFLSAISLCASVERDAASAPGGEETALGRVFVGGGGITLILLMGFFLHVVSWLRIHYGPIGKAVVAIFGIVCLVAAGYLAQDAARRLLARALTYSGRAVGDVVGVLILTVAAPIVLLIGIIDGALWGSSKWAGDANRWPFYLFICVVIVFASAGLTAGGFVPERDRRQVVLLTAWSFAGLAALLRFSTSKYQNGSSIMLFVAAAIAVLCAVVLFNPELKGWFGDREDRESPRFGRTAEGGPGETMEHENDP